MGSGAGEVCVVGAMALAQAARSSNGTIRMTVCVTLNFYSFVSVDAMGRPVRTPVPGKQTPPALAVGGFNSTRPVTYTVRGNRVRITGSR